ncbi:MAG: SufE family protein [Gemmatimonadales bacterium]|nr:SufE family protein [Gemmatimonadales bacterium]
MTPRLEKVIARWQAADRATRLETLLDYSRNLPPLPDRYAGARDDAHRVHECQTPVHLWVELGADGLHLHADVPRESPTVRGFVALLVKALDGATPAQVAAVPADLLDRLGLAELLGMTRIHGLSAVLARVKRAAAATAPA